MILAALRLPVASAWLPAWQRDAGFELYAADGLHPSPTDSYLTALMIYAKILNRSPIGLPARVGLRSGALIAVDPATATTLQQVAAAAAGF